MTERENEDGEDGEDGAFVSRRTVGRLNYQLRVHEETIRRYESALADTDRRLRDAELGVKRERFIRIMAMELGQILLPSPARYELNEQGALDASWQLAKALWDAKPEDC